MTDVLATKLLSVTARRISTCVTHGDGHNPSPISPADDTGAVQPVKEGGVQNGGKNSKALNQGRVKGVGHRVAASRRPRVALVARSTAPSLWNGGGGDAARRSESHDERNERVVEHHCGE